MRENFWPRIPDAITLEELNSRVALWAQERDQRIHGTTFERPGDRWRAEVEARHARYVVSHTQMAHLPFHKTLDQYDFTFQPSLDEQQGRQLLTLQWVDAAENLIVLGPPGVGKTHIVVAMAVQAIRERIPVYFMTIQDLVADLRKAWDENCFAARLSLYIRPRLLCIDEVSYTARGSNLTVCD